VTGASAALADTSLFVALEAGHDLDDFPDELFASVITLAELRAGVLVAGTRADRARRLATYTDVCEIEALPVDRVVADEWANLRVRLREAGRRMPVNDSWIAATALAHGLPVATQDDDYDAASGLRVIRF
jgi:predicted nucleic acid-binding protein